MAITNADMLAPTGPVEVTLFPGEDISGAAPPATILEERLDVYIAQAVAKNAAIAFDDMDAANLAWALHLAFQAAYIVAVARPASENSQIPVLGSEGYAKDQRDALLAKANEYFDDYNMLLMTVPTTSAPSGVPTRSTPLEYEW